MFFLSLYPNWKAIGLGIFQEITSPNALQCLYESSSKSSRGLWVWGGTHHEESHMMTWEQMKRSLTATTSSFSHTPILGILVTWWYLHTTYLLENYYDHDKRKLSASKSFDRMYLPECGGELRTVSCDRQGRIFNCFLINSCKGRTVYYLRTDETRRLIRHRRISDSVIEYRI